MVLSQTKRFSFVLKFVFFLEKSLLLQKKVVFHKFLSVFSKKFSVI